MNCPKCGTLAVEGDRFCESCGANLTGEETPVPDSAQACGHPTLDADGYCTACGVLGPDPRDHTSSVAGAGAGVSDKGRRHAKNEDAYFLGAGSRVAALVCDGVSSSVDPEVASDGAARAGGEVLSREGDPIELVKAACAASAKMVTDLGRGVKDAPACTWVGGIVDGRTITMGWVGDSRAYLLTDKLVQISEDDSWAAGMIRGGMDIETAMKSKHAHAITRWLGADAAPEDMEAHVTQVSADGPGMVLVCSDGLWNYLDTLGAMEEALRARMHLSPLEMAESLVAYANEQGGSDNITVVLVPVT